MIHVVILDFDHRIGSRFAVQNHLTTEYISGIVAERTRERKNFCLCACGCIPAVIHSEDRNHDFRVVNNELVFCGFPIRLRFEDELVASRPGNPVLGHPSIFIQNFCLLQSVRQICFLTVDDDRKAFWFFHRHARLFHWMVEGGCNRQGGILRVGNDLFIRNHTSEVGVCQRADRQKRQCNDSFIHENLGQ